jgi:hypothetical protein
MTRRKLRFAAVFPPRLALCHDDPMRTRTVWLLTLPFLLLSETFGHTVVARTLDSGASHHRLVLHLSGGYLEYALAAIAVLLVLVSAILVRRALASSRAQGPRPLPSWKLAVLPSLAFLLQEQVERLVQGGGADWLTFAEPVVLAGLLPQLLCGLLALSLVRTLLRAADELGCALARRSARAARRRPARHLPRPVQASALPLPLPVLASRHAGRAPPALA